MKITPFTSDKLDSLNLNKKLRQKIRNKAISRAETRIILAGKKPKNFKSTELEIIVQEEEQKIKSELKEKGVMAVLAFLGISFLG